MDYNFCNIVTVTRAFLYLKKMPIPIFPPSFGYNFDPGTYPSSLTFFPHFLATSLSASRSSVSLDLLCVAFVEWMPACLALLLAPTTPSGKMFAELTFLFGSLQRLPRPLCQSGVAFDITHNNNIFEGVFMVVCRNCCLLWATLASFVLAFASCFCYCFASWPLAHWQSAFGFTESMFAFVCEFARSNAVSITIKLDCSCTLHPANV